MFRRPYRSPGGRLRSGSGLAVCCLLLLAAPPLRGEGGPWRLGSAVGSPDWLVLGGSYRLRYESLSSSLRPGVEESDQILASRLLFALRLGGEKVFVTLELEDSRAFLDDGATPLGTDDVNAAELLQAHLGFAFEDALQAGDRLELQAGRLTLDVGSRRLVARNRFRNTLNGFTGVSALWQARGSGGEDGATADGVQVRAFFLLPVTRRPLQRDRLDDNDAQLDRESSSQRFAGVHLSHPILGEGLEGEVYAYSLEEEDRPSAQSRNRELLTAGIRLLRSPASGRWDFELEAALQVGESRGSTSAADTVDLDHEAWFAHLHAARTLAGRGKPRLVLQYDYASGDDDPTDGDNGRFDTLFGARRFEFGPTGIFGLLARSNISSPGARIELSPWQGRSLMVAYRAAWLASRRDALTTIGLQDPGGASDSFIGHLLETRIRVNLLPGNLGLELGGAHLFAGAFLTSRPQPLDDVTYAYLQTTFTF